MVDRGVIGSYESSSIQEELRVEKRTDPLNLADDIIRGHEPSLEQFESLADRTGDMIWDLVSGADRIRAHHFGNEVHLCTICNGKSGRCTEDCTFCTQSIYHQTDIETYPLMGKEDLKKGGVSASESPIHRFSIVTSGKALPSHEVTTVSQAMSELDQAKIQTCASLGCLGRADLLRLRDAGVTRYHHNLETSESFFDQMCTTHTYQTRVDTLLIAKELGFSICSGGVFGIGETDRQILELALAIKQIGVDAVPINFLTPVKGTRAEHFNYLTPERCLKIIALFRYVLPEKDIFICGGRESNLGHLHARIFEAGATGIMTGNYLTTAGQTLENDLDMIDRNGFTIRDS